MKRYLENLSVELGFGGEINDETINQGLQKMNTLFDMEMIEAKETALLFNKAKDDYHQSFQRLLKSIKPLDNNRFWELLKHYRSEVVQYVLMYKRCTEDAASEFFRKTTFGTMRATCTWNFDEALAFVVAYELKSKELYQPLFDIVEGRGDDGYGDLLDSLPLAGRETFDKCMGRKFFDNEEFEDFVKHALSHGDTPVVVQLQQHVLHGENYNRMHLQEQAQKFFALKVLNDD